MAAVTADTMRRAMPTNVAQRTTTDAAIASPHARPADDVARELQTDAQTGLSTSKARRRLDRYGPNVLRESKGRSPWSMLLHQFRSLVVLLLVVASILSGVTGDLVEAGAIAAVIVINAAIGFFSEWRAEKSMAALRKLGRVLTIVRRDGKTHEIPADSIVPGDVVVVEGGDIISADMRLAEASKLQADESTLTGESVPVEKSVEPVDEDAPIAERSSMLYKGTAVTRGSGIAVVVATAMNTELGKISELVEQQADVALTPLEERLNRLGRMLVWLTVAVSILVIIAGALRGKDLHLIVMTAIALAVAAVPEGLPIVATLALARGMWRMAKRNAIINRLAAVETLGACDVICTDKTGTLTENRMAARRIALAEGDISVGGEAIDLEGKFTRDDESINPLEHPVLKPLLEVAALCNNASWSSIQRYVKDRDEDHPAIGEPMEIALLVLAGKAGIDVAELRQRMPEQKEIAFDPEVKMMATYNQRDGALVVCVKGAPEAVLEASVSVMTADGERELNDDQRAEWHERNERLGNDGFRLLAVAQKAAESVKDKPFEKLTLLGMAALMDPPREAVAPALEACRTAGIRVIMVTGDQAGTARAIAQAVGLISRDDDVEIATGKNIKPVDQLSAAERTRLQKIRVFARVSPKQKLDLINIHKRAGSVVAMTGDGVNDAPALKHADIGVAMGKRGTQIAREAADVVLRDDAFATIVHAVQQGRVIFHNIRSFIRYLISCNLSEILVVFIATMINAPLPLLPLQILFLNLVTDVFPALALGLGEGDKLVMQQRPRPAEESLLTKKNWVGVAFNGLVISAAVLGALGLALYALDYQNERAVTVSFLTLALAQLWHVFNMRPPGSRGLINEITRNQYIWGALAICCGLIAASVWFPPFARVLDTHAPDSAGWLVIFGMSLVPVLVGQPIIFIRGRMEGISSTPARPSLE